MELGEGSRTMIKAKEVARKKASKRKKAGRKYRALEAAGNGGEEEDIEGEDRDMEVEGRLQETKTEAVLEKGREAQLMQKGEASSGRSNKPDPP
jgi:hypothetical protein